MKYFLSAFIAMAMMLFPIWIFAQAELSPVPSKLLTDLTNSKPDAGRVRLLLEIGEDHLHFTNVPKAHLDSAVACADSAIALSNILKDESLLFDCYALKGYVLVRTGNVAGGESCFLKVAGYHHKQGRLPEEAQDWTNLGDVINMDSPEHDALKIGYYHHAEALYLQMHEPLRAVEIQKKIADVFLNQRKLNEAGEQLLQVLAKLQSLHEQKLHPVYDLLAGVARLKGDLKDELTYRLEVIKSMEATADFKNGIEYYGRLGLTYTSLEMHSKAEAAYRKALAAVSSEFYYYYFYRYVLALTDNLLAQERAAEALDFINASRTKMPKVRIQDRIYIEMAIGRCYLRLNRFDIAYRHYMSAARLNDSGFRVKLIIPRDRLSNNAAIAKMLIDAGRYNEASVYISNNTVKPEDLVAPMAIANLEYLRYRSDSAAKDFGSALNHYRQYTRIRDSIFSIEETRKIDQIQYKLETEKKDADLVLKAKDIESLTRRNQVQAELVRQSLLIRNLVTGGLVLLLLLLAIVYNRYQLKRRSNVLLEGQRQEIDLQNRSLQELNEQQKTLITEKEWLLKEIHHRVKNNLQTSISLLNIQSSHLSSGEALQAIKDSQRRMNAMSLIHQRLYQTDSMTSIDMQVYIRELLTYLVESFGSPGNIRVVVSVASVELDVEQAIPLGLIINEGVTNALKYAFPQHAAGHIRIMMRVVPGDATELVIEDDGIGFPSGQYNEKSSSLGLKLMRGLAEQLEGQLDIRGDAGTRISFTFNKDHVRQRQPV